MAKDGVSDKQHRKYGEATALKDGDITSYFTSKLNK
jgi:hypothetical protein